MPTPRKKIQGAIELQHFYTSGPLWKDISPCPPLGPGPAKNITLTLLRLFSFLKVNFLNHVQMTWNIGGIDLMHMMSQDHKIQNAHAVRGHACTLLLYTH